MASQTVMNLCSSFTPRLSPFNSPTPTLLTRPPPRSFNCPSALPTAHLKGSFGGIRVPQMSRDFKCHASSNGTSETLSRDVWQDIHDAENNKEMTELGMAAVDKHNETAAVKITFEGVLKAERQLADGINYKLIIIARDGTVTKVYEAVVSIAPPVAPKVFESLTLLVPRMTG